MDGYKGHQIGSRKEAIHRLYDAEGPEQARKQALKMGIKASTISSWLAAFSKGHNESHVAIGRVFMHGRSQAVRLPAAFRMPGDRVRVRRVGGGAVLIEPILSDIDTWFAEIDKYKDIPFPDRPEQPPMPKDQDLLD